ncbi:hypothetical protein CHS0354_031117 [Potamilus streckersoni]|uniref:Uncharacterized protein n=1 Tax=Potamilus streckersoni TaxID=2493646 RepID=A0AAE0W9X3_9BIVA|nr:hypothetical protein CHS0354_031117 [Potamilus streckersoni]
MPTKFKVLALFLILCLVVIVGLFLKNVYHQDDSSDLSVQVHKYQELLKSISESIRSAYGLPTIYNFTSKQRFEEITGILIQQRNDASREVNKLKRLMGQIQCQTIAEEGTKTSHTGGWCRQESKEDSGKHWTDKDLAKALAELFKGKSVASFGDGPGRYKQLIEGAGKGVIYDAYDGAPFCEETSEGRVKFMDLTLPQFGLPMYDWVISLEVAEHIPKQFEGVYLDNINRHAREGVVLSWAVPGQGGYGHVNERFFDYVVKIMEKNELYFDREQSQVLQKAATVKWLKDNVNVYVRRNRTRSDNLDKLLV